MTRMTRQNATKVALGGILADQTPQVKMTGDDKRPSLLESLESVHATLVDVRLTANRSFGQLVGSLTAEKPEGNPPKPNSVAGWIDAIQDVASDVNATVHDIESAI